jgi:hypothetical protein
MPDIPEPGLLFIYSTLAMLAGVAWSYYKYPVDGKLSNSDRLSMLERRANGGRIFLIGSSITVIVACAVLIYSTNVQLPTTGILATLFRIEHKQDVMASGQGDMITRLEKLEHDQAEARKQYTKDSLAWAKQHRAQEQVLKNQSTGLANQRQTLRNQKKIMNGEVTKGITFYPYLPPKGISPSVSTSLVQPLIKPWNPPSSAPMRRRNSKGKNETSLVRPDAMYQEDRRLTNIFEPPIED